MKDLLIAIKLRLQNEVPILKGEQSVHIIPDENLLPETTDFPCVGLKDGEIVHTYKLGMTRQKDFLSVDIFCYVALNDLATVMIGTTANPGILDLIVSARQALENWAPTGYAWMNDDNGNVNETASQTLMALDDRRVQKKSFGMRWKKGITV